MAYDPFGLIPANVRTLRPGVSNWASYPASGVILDKGEWDAQRAITDGLKVCSWVYACVDMRAKGVSSVPWIVQRRVGRAYNSRSWERDYGNKYENLIERPNEFITRKYLMHFQSMHLDTGGNALFKKVTVGAGTESFRVAELWPLKAHRAFPVPDETGDWIGAYRIMDPKRIYEIPANLVIHAQRPDPENPFWGMSPLQVLAGTVDTDVAMVRANRTLAKNDNMPAAIISDQNITTPEQLAQVQDALDARWARPQRGKPMVLPKGTNFIKLALTPQELDYLASRKWNVSEICAAYDILPAVFDGQQASYANLANSIEYMWEMGIMPQLEVIRDALNLSLLTATESETTFIDFDLSNVKALKVQFTRAVADFRQLVQTGVPQKTANDRVGLNLPRYPFDDRSLYEGRWLGTAPGQFDTPTDPNAAAPTTPGKPNGADTSPNLAERDKPTLPAPNNPSSPIPPMSGKSITNGHMDPDP